MSATPNGPVKLDSGTRLAVDRTRLAYERTLMAWVRTAASMISFGFTIYKFFQFELRDSPPVPDRWIGPREFAMMLIVMGLVALVLATIQHRQSMQLMRAEYGHLPPSTSAIVATLFSVIGLIAFGTVLFHK